MVDLKIDVAKQQTLRKEYYDCLVKWIGTEGKWGNTGNDKTDKMMKYIQSNAHSFFLAPAHKLRERSNVFSKTYQEEKKEYENATRENKPLTSYGLFIKRMRDIYNGFMKEKDESHGKKGYWLMKELNVKVCPYCNRNYTITIHTKNIQVRPEYDHFYPEANYPSLILSFYNLVPSCPQCNRLKRTQELDVNPWIGYSTIKRPTFRVDTSEEDFPESPKLIIIDENENIRKLGIKELYNEHTDYVKDILNKIQAYNPATYHAISKDFQGIVHTESDLDRIVWGNYSKYEDEDKRPLAKLIVDILDQYKKYL